MEVGLIVSSELALVAGGEFADDEHRCRSASPVDEADVSLTALGAWLLFAPNIFSLDIRSPAADIAHIGGAIVIVGAVIAMAEVIRALRLVNVAAGLAIAGLVVLTDAGTGYATAMVVTGLGIAALSIPRGSIRERYGGWTLLTR